MNISNVKKIFVALALILTAAFNATAAQAAMGHERLENISLSLWGYRYDSNPNGGGEHPDYWWDAQEVSNSYVFPDDDKIVLHLANYKGEEVTGAVWDLSESHEEVFATLNDIPKSAHYFVYYQVKGTEDRSVCPGVIYASDARKMANPTVLIYMFYDYHHDEISCVAVGLTDD